MSPPPKSANHPADPLGARCKERPGEGFQHHWEAWWWSFSVDWADGWRQWDRAGVMVQWVIKTMVQGLDPWGGVMDTVEWGRGHGAVG